MRTTGQGDGQPTSTAATNRRGGDRLALAQLRHDIRNHLNAIKLTCARLQRRRVNDLSEQSLHDINRCADSIDELVTRFLGGADAPGIHPAQQDGAQA